MVEEAFVCNDDTYPLLHLSKEVNRSFCHTTDDKESRACP